METNQTHEKIIQILEEKGPSLPIKLSKEIGMSSLFVSAFLSELTNEKRIKVSHLKVGGSPLYFLEGQEEKLENFYKFLHPRESEAFLLLKKMKILKDSEQEPATRVALRSIRDFAIGFKKQDEIYWKYYLIHESEIKLTKNKKPQTIKKPTIKKEPVKIKKQEKTQTKTSFQNPLIIPSKSKQKKQRPRSDFVLNVIQILSRFQIIEEKEYKLKEYNCITQIRTELGPINFLTQAKNKKTVSEADLKKLVSKAQSIPLPAFMIYTEKLSKKAQEYVQKYSSVLKTKKII